MALYKSFARAIVATVPLDLTQPRTYAAAVHGMRGLFLLRPPLISNVRETLNVLIDQAIDAGVEHIAFLSVNGADRHSWVPHHAIEAHLITSGISQQSQRAGCRSPVRVRCATP